MAWAGAAQSGAMLHAKEYNPQYAQQGARPVGVHRSAFLWQSAPHPDRDVARRIPGGEASSMRVYVSGKPFSMTVVRTSLSAGGLELVSVHSSTPRWLAGWLVGCCLAGWLASWLAACLPANKTSRHK